MGCKKIPDKVEALASDSYRYLKYSSKRTQQLLNIQRSLDIPEHKILKLFQLRWTSLQSAVSRYVEQYAALHEFFKMQCLEKGKTGEKAKPIIEFLMSHWYDVRVRLQMGIRVRYRRRNYVRLSEPDSPLLSIPRLVSRTLRTIARCYILTTTTETEFGPFGCTFIEQETALLTIPTKKTWCCDFDYR